MQPVIMHIDMNSFFASCEQQDNPAWRGQPVGVCEHLGGILIAASVEAKRWGIGTGTPVWEARKLYPKIFLTHTHPEQYRLYSRRLVHLVADYTHKVERASIDEVYMDVTASCNIKFPSINFSMASSRPNPNASENESVLGQPLSAAKRHPSTRMRLVGMIQSAVPARFIAARRLEWQYADPVEEAVKIAREIKRRMKIEVGDWLRCSVGIADNKVLAKIAAEQQKPDGLVAIVETQNAKIKMQNLGSLSFTKNDLYNQLKLTDIPGIGRRQEKNLNQLGIKTLADLKNCPPSWLVARFGPIGGHHLYHLGRLESSWKPQVEQERGIKSMGHMYTLPREFRERKFFVPVLYKLAEMVGRRLRKQNLQGNLLHFYLSDSRHEYFGQSRRLGYFLYDGREIFLESLRIFESLQVADKIFKLIGVTVAGLRPYIHQQSLFGDEERKRQVAAALDIINQKYGDFTICRVPILSAGRVFRDSIGFGRIKEL